jgi:CRP/FNR family transcriptional regulator
LSERFGRLGYSRASFALRMTRQEMGSYLGIKLETVSRTFSAFAAAGLIAVHRKAVTLRDLAGLRRIVEPQADDGVERRARDRRPSPTARPGRALPRLPSFSLVAA